MIRTFDRYLLKTFLINYLCAAGVLTSLYVVLDLFVNIDEFTEGGEDLGRILANIADFYFFNLPMYFSQIASVITMFAACLTLAQLHRANEITAVLASGTSLYRMVLPIVLAGLAMNGLLILDHEVILPKVASKLARERDDVAGTHAYEIWCVQDSDKRLISAQVFSPKQERIRGLIIMELSTDPATRGQMGDVITADKAHWNSERGGWDLIGGKRTSITARTGGRLSSGQSIERKTINFYPCDLKPEELLFRKMAQWTRFLSIAQLNQLERRGDVDPEQIAQVRHSRFTAPITNMILLLLGMSFFMTRLPNSVLTQGAKSLGTCAICFLIAFAGQQAVGSTGLDPSIPAWLPIFLFGPLAVLLLDNVKT